jgi:general secretion pathway protein H
LVKAHDAGFTLLELLVVLAIVSLLAVTLPGRLTRGVDPVRMEAAARMIAIDLAKTRSAAMSSGRQTLFVVDPEAVSYQAGAEPSTTLPPGTRITLLTAAQEQMEGGRGAIRFYPDGGATGGRVTLLARNGLERAITVDWLSGHVSLAP